MKNIPVKIDVPKPPATPKIPVTDVCHGISIVDPYRWLEDGSSSQTKEWTEAQNRRTTEVLEQLPQKTAYARQLEALMGRDSIGAMVYRGNRLFYTMRKSGADQMVLCVRDLSGGSGERVLVDPNLGSDKGLLALDWWYPSDDGRMLAYGCSLNGDEWSVLYVKDVDTGEDRRERIERTRMASVTWDRDNSGFYYCRYPKPGEVPPGEENYHHHLFHHTLGSDSALDPKVFGDGRPKDEFYHVTLSADGRHVVLTVRHGWSRDDVYLKATGDPSAEFTPVVEGLPAHFEVLAVTGDTIYILTDHLTPHGRICAAPLDSPSIESWREVLAEDPSFTIDNAQVCGDSIVVSGLVDASSRLAIASLDGTCPREVPLPMLGTVSMLSTQMDSPEVFFRFESFALAPVIYRMYVDGSGAPQVFLRSDQPSGADEIGVEQLFYKSKDGTRIPMFVLRKKGPALAGPRPTVLTGYGGFNLGKTPAYSDSAIPWLLAGGTFAIANLRGGNEYGEEWHKAGMRENKQNVFDDFITAGQFLVDQGFTDRSRLGIWGRSNGGLLVGAALTQKPDLYSAVACGVPLLDMVRYHKFLIAYLWCDEYGNPDKPGEFPYLYAYSPYHKVQEGLIYPAVYFYTALSDSRVDPLHARKMTAKLQEVQASTGFEGPVLLRVESEAGHGVGKPLHKVIEEQAEMWAFLAWRLGLKMD